MSISSHPSHWLPCSVVFISTAYEFQSHQQNELLQQELVNGGSNYCVAFDGKIKTIDFSSIFNPLPVNQNQMAICKQLRSGGDA